MDPQSGRLSAAQGNCRNAASSGGARGLRPHGRLGLLWAQRCRRRGRRCRADPERLSGQPGSGSMQGAGEHTSEPYGPAMITKARAALDGDGIVADWQYEVWSNTHSTRPGPAGYLASAQLLQTAFTPPPPTPIPQPEGGGDRNAIPLYKFRNARIVHHFVPSMPLRVSALRSLGAYMNIFSIESFVDQLAKAAGADPVEFRLRHMEDPRARDVIRTAAERFGWAAYQPRKA